jgi:hypothetical protein
MASQCASCSPVSARHHRQVTLMGAKPKLLILIHTEEEFDWGKPFSRESRGVFHIPRLLEYQEMFSQFHASVAYAVSYPVAENESSASFIKEVSESFENVTIGMHCHPWVNPPYDEVVNSFNSYPGNLPFNQEKEKLVKLYEKIEENIGSSPEFYLAGRYGIGNNTYNILNDLGVKTDFSPMPFYDYSAQDGPNFSQSSTRVTVDQNILVIPHSSGFIGWLSKGGEKPALLNYRQLVKLRITSAFSILGGFSQVILTPEGFSLKQMKALTIKLIKSNHDTIVLSFHSTSIVPGLNPFVSNLIERTHFFEQLQQYLEFYVEELNGEFLSLK